MEEDKRGQPQPTILPIKNYCSVKYDLRNCHSALDAESTLYSSGFLLPQE